LVSILSESEEAFALVSTKSDVAAWIGLTDAGHSGLYKWSDGWPMQISNWGQPPINGQTSCISQNVTDGKWYEANCQTKLPFLCKHSTAQPPTVGPNGECPRNDFTDLDQNYQYCYYFESTNTLSWDDSQRACKAYGNGASLASIHSEDVMNKVLGELSTTQMTSWIGLFTTQNSGTNYFWVDDSAVDFTNWEEGEPNGNGAFGTELCIQAYAHNGKWNDASCTDKMAYICKIPKIQITTPTPPKTTTPDTVMTTTPSKSSTSKTIATTSKDATTTTFYLPPDTTGMSSGSIAVVVIVCLIALAGGAVFLVMYFKRESRLRKLLASIGQETPRQNISSFDNVGYENSSSSQMPPTSSSDA